MDTNNISKRVSTNHRKTDIDNQSMVLLILFVDDDHFKLIYHFKKVLFNEAFYLYYIVRKIYSMEDGGVFLLKKPIPITDKTVGDIILF